MAAEKTLTMSNLHISDAHLDHFTKCAVLNMIWDENFLPGDVSRDFSLGASYLHYYSEQCKTAWTRHAGSFSAVVNTHQDILTIIEGLKDLQVPRERMKDHLRLRIPSLSPEDGDKLLCEAIDLAVRLWLMIDVGEMTHSFIPGQESLMWGQGCIQVLVDQRFRPQVTLKERIKLNRLFTAQNLERIAGLQIFWTSNLADHLRLMVDDTKVAIFHHASFLEHRQSSRAYPQGLIEETLRTLSLLLPQYDKGSRKWFRGHQKRWLLDGKASNYGHLSTEQRQIENFVFWHDRLIILKQAFDEAEPSTIKQWWCDRRRRVQWYTFWVAAMVLGLTIFFGMVQCIEGGLQVYKAYYP
jgi:hypothetical protein